MTRLDPAPEPAPTVRRGDPTLPYRRRIRLLRIDSVTVWGGLEDDFHHFEVTLTHDGHQVTQIEMEALRWPWATCPDAGANLALLVGMELSDRCTAVAGVADQPVRSAPVDRFDQVAAQDRWDHDGRSQEMIRNHRAERD